jgi:MFS transporter, DHA1 family, multidrug resistance protein
MQTTVRPALLAIVTGLVFAVGPATVDFSLPAMPAIQASIGTPALRVELTLTLLLAAIAVSQLLFGAVADRYGRRIPLLVSLGAYGAGAWGAAIASSLPIFAAARVVQAFAFGIATVVVRCAVTDVCDERRTAGVFSTAVMMVSVASVIAPAVGGEVLTLWGWRAVFFGMGAFGIAVCVTAAALLPETSVRERRTRSDLSDVLGTYGTLLRNTRFVVPAAIGGCAAAFQFAYNTGGPGAVIEHYGTSPARAGVFFSIIALSTAVASQTNALLLEWFSPERLTSMAARVSVAASVAVLLSSLTGYAGVGGLIVSLFVLIATLGFIMGNTMAAAISNAGIHAGAASALVGVMQFVFGTAASMPIGLSHDASGRLMGVVLVVLGVIALALDMWGRRPAAPSPA